MWKENDVCMLLGCVNKSQPWPWAWHSEFQISGWEDTVCTNGCWIAGAQLIYPQIKHMPAGVSRLPPPARGRQVHGSFPLNSTPLPIIHTVHRKPSTFQTTASFPHDANTIFDLYISLSDHPMNSFHTTTHQNSTPRRSGNCYREIRVKFLEIIIS